MGRRERRKTIDWLISGAGEGVTITDMRMGMRLELSKLKRQSVSLYHSVLRGYTKARKKQEREQRRSMRRTK